MNLSLVWSFIVGASLNFQVFNAGSELANQDVRLQKLSSEGKLEFVATQPTNPMGKVLFRFEADESENARYVASTSFEGRQFFSQAVSLASDPKTIHKLQVYRSQSSSKGLRIKELQLSIRYVDDQLVVEESFLVENTTEFLLTGDKTPEGPELMRFPLPARIFNWNRLYGFRDNFRVDGKELVLSEALSPGDHYFSYAYRIVEPKLSVDLSRDFLLPIEKIRFSTNSPKIKVDLPVDYEAREKKFYRGEWYQTYEAQMNDEWRDVLNIQVGGLPLNIPLSWWLPFLGLLAFFCFAFAAQFGLKAELSATSMNLEPQLRELNRIDSLLERNAIDRSEHRKRKLQILQKLVPLYMSRDKIKSSVDSKSA